jgi:hypothetical protein
VGEGDARVNPEGVLGEGGVLVAAAALPVQGDRPPAEAGRAVPEALAQAGERIGGTVARAIVARQAIGPFVVAGRVDQGSLETGENAPRTRDDGGVVADLAAVLRVAEEDGEVGPVPVDRLGEGVDAGLVLGTVGHVAEDGEGEALGDGTARRRGEEKEKKERKTRPAMAHRGMVG